MIVVIAFKNIYNLDLNTIKVILLGFIAVPLELWNKKGSDNLSLPLGISLCSYILESWI